MTAAGVFCWPTSVSRDRSTDGTRYDVSSAGLQIVQNGEVVSSEPAIESAS